MSYFLLDTNRRHYIGSLKDEEALYAFLHRETGIAEIKKACEFMCVRIVKDVDLTELEKGYREHPTKEVKP